MLAYFTSKKGRQRAAQQQQRQDYLKLITADHVGPPEIAARASGANGNAHA
nr:hypothetical protein [Cronobacter dublinensis]